jgi:hypothetical protein
LSKLAFKSHATRLQAIPRKTDVSVSFGDYVGRRSPLRGAFQFYIKDKLNKNSILGGKSEKYMRSRWILGKQFEKWELD